jgi:hypothetical protein
VRLPRTRDFLINAQVEKWDEQREAGTFAYKEKL